MEGVRLLFYYGPDVIIVIVIDAKSLLDDKGIHI